MVKPKSKKKAWSCRKIVPHAAVRIKDRIQRRRCLDKVIRSNFVIPCLAMETCSFHHHTVARVPQHANVAIWRGKAGGTAGVRVPIGHDNAIVDDIGRVGVNMIRGDLQKVVRPCAGSIHGCGSSDYACCGRCCGPRGGSLDDGECKRCRAFRDCTCRSRLICDGGG